MIGQHEDGENLPKWLSFGNVDGRIVQHALEGPNAPQFWVKSIPYLINLDNTELDIKNFFKKRKINIFISITIFNVTKTITPKIGLTYELKQNITVTRLSQLTKSNLNGFTLAILK